VPGLLRRAVKAPWKNFTVLPYPAPKCDVLHTSLADVALPCTPGGSGPLIGGAHVSTEARVYSRHHARGAFDVHEGCPKASKRCNCDNRASNFPADDADSVLSAALRHYVDGSIAQRAPCVINRVRLKLLDDGQARKSFVEFGRRGLESVAQRGDFGA
jgi:hypothetical protein